MKILKGDLVAIVTGKDEGKTGKVEKVLTKENKVVVEGVNLFKRHIKARTQGQKSEIVTITKPLPQANVALICPKCKEQTRVGYIVSKDSKERICRKCKAVI
ncbi:MAG: 50S ribosomal protein L24 [Patescibacteria group bacterium]